MSTLIRNLSKFWARNSSKILTVASAGGVVATGVTSYIAGTKVPLIVDRLREEYGDDIPKKELAKAVAVPMLPPLFSGGLTIASIAVNEALNTRQKAFLTGLVSAGELVAQKQQAKIKELLGAEKARAVQDDIQKDALKEYPVSQAHVIATGKGDSLCMDAWTHQYFTSDIFFIERMVNEFNRRLIGEMWLSLNDWYDLIGLPQAECGDYLYFNVDRQLELEYTFGESDDGRPCRIIWFKKKPKEYEHGRR